MAAQADWQMSEPSRSGVGRKLLAKKDQYSDNNWDAQIKRLGLKAPKLTDPSTSIADINGSRFRFENVVPPPSVDWRLTAAYTPVKSQFQCGSCWAVAAADAISMTWAIFQGYGARPAPPLNSDGSVPEAVLALDMSPQQVCDCGAVGSCCAGGWPETAFQYAAANGGLSRMQDYPYFGADNASCATKTASKAAAQITGWELTPPRDVAAMRKALAYGPVVVLVSAADPEFQAYAGGVFRGSCSLDLNHALLLVGYGTDPVAGPFWIAKNSWGALWGESGHMRIAATEGVGQCGITSTGGIYPVYYPTSKDKDPCVDAYPPPCGAGRCYTQQDPASKVKVARCSCPGGFVENAGGKARCLPADPCSQNPNPCGAGKCKNAPDGTYTCSCPAGTTVGGRADGAVTCVAGGGAGGVRTYTVNPGDTCNGIMKLFGLSQAVFNQYNQGISCKKLLPGTLVAVGSDVASAGGCAASYEVLNGDTCPRIASACQLALAQLQALNPSMSCNKLLAGQMLCVAPTAPGGAPPAVSCGMAYDVQRGNSMDSCQALVTKFKLDWTTFYQLNPGLKCDAPLSPSLSICVAPAGSPIAPRMGAGCTQTYRVQHGDTCPKLWAAARLTAAQFRLLNPGVRCTAPYFQVGQGVCLAGAQLDSVFANGVPYIVVPGDTLGSIAQAFAARCGTYATPANICSQNLLLSCSAPPPPGTTLQVPCQWPVGRACGCTPAVRVCGADGNWYSSYCDAVCNYASPASTGGCSSCQLACRDRCGAYQYPARGAPDYCPSPCPYPPWPPISWNYFGVKSPCAYYYQACSSCCAGGWGYGSGYYWNCVAYCKYGKC
eukprot:jgi/Mesen1/10433/ME000082S09941